MSETFGTVRLLWWVLALGCSSSTSSKFLVVDGGAGADGGEEGGAAGASGDAGAGGTWAGSGGTGGSGWGGGAGTAAGATGGATGGSAGSAGGTGGSAGGPTCGTPSVTTSWPARDVCLFPGSQGQRHYAIAAGSCTIAWDPPTLAGATAFYTYSASCSAQAVRGSECGIQGFGECTFVATGDGSVSVTATGATGSTTWAFSGCPDPYDATIEGLVGEECAPDLDEAIRAAAKAACIF